MSELGLYQRLLREARPYALHFAALLLLGFIASATALLYPVPLQIVVDSVLGARPLPPILQAHTPDALLRSPAAMLVGAIALLVVVTLLGQVLNLASTLLRTLVGERLVLGLRARLVDGVQRLSLAYHDARGTSDSLYRIQQDAQAIQSLMVEGAVPFVSAALTLGLMIAVTARLDGPLALVDSSMPVVAIAPNDTLLEKLKSNLQEVRARGGELYVVADADSHIQSSEGLHVLRLPEHAGLLSPIVHTIPLQLLAYHTAVIRGTDVDKPRNLAKSVTVE